MLQTVIFSKDRPAQLDLLLRSIEFLMVGRDKMSATVLFRSTAKAYSLGYAHVQARHPDFRFLEEQSFRYDVQALTLGNNAKYLQFLTDDDVFIRPFSLADDEFLDFQEDDRITALVLRMGRQMDYCYTENVNVNPPEFGPKGTWSWRGHPCDWGYPHSVDGTIWAMETVHRVLTRGPWNSPNSVEPALLPSMRGPLALCYDKSRLVSIPNNSVQDAFRTNRHAGGDPAAMNERFLAGERIALEPLIGMDPRSPHVEVEYEWETR